MMKTKILSVFLLTVILSLVMVSAAVTYVNPTDGTTVLTKLEATGNHNTAVTVSFKILNDAVAELTDIVLTKPAELISTTDNTKKILVTQLSLSPSTIPNILTSGTSSIITLTVNIPESLAPGIYEADLVGDGKQGGSAVSPFNKKISITVNPDLSLKVSDKTITSLDPSATVTVTNDGNQNFNNVALEVLQFNGVTLVPSIPLISPSTAGNSVTNVVVTIADILSKLNVGLNLLTLKATADDTAKTSATGTITIEKTFCKLGEQGGTDLEISDIRIDNSDGDDEEWSPLDKIEILVEVTNNRDKDHVNAKMKDVHVEIALYNSEGKNVMNQMQDLNSDEIDLRSVKAGDEDTAVFTFKIPSKFDDDNYRLAIKAFSKDEKEEKLCVSKSSDLDKEFYHEIEGTRIKEDDEHIILDNIKVSPSPAQCGERIQVSAEVVNVGDDDYEDQVKITIANKDFVLNLEKVIRKNFDIGDDENVEFEFDIPEGTEEKLHTLEFKTYYGYDEDEDEYDETSKDTFITTIRVAGNCQQAGEVEIDADFDSETPEAVAGKQVIINAVIKNVGDEEATYTVSVSGNSAWSSLISVDPQTVTIAPGESKEVSLVFSVNEDAEGTKRFTIKTSSNGVQVGEKIVTLPVSASQQQLTPFVENVRSNWFIYLIILVNVILIIAIILVIRSMVSPRGL